MEGRRHVGNHPAQEARRAPAIKRLPLPEKGREHAPCALRFSWLEQRKAPAGDDRLLEKQDRQNGADHPHENIEA